VQEYEARVVKRAAEAAAQTGETEVAVEIQPASAAFGATGQEVLMEFGFIKDRDGFLRSATATAADENTLSRYIVSFFSFNDLPASLLSNEQQF
jgi:Tfp pilus assembly protein PilX